MQLITPSDFDSFIQGDLVLVDFFAPWCGPCKVISPHLESLSQKYGDKLSFGKFNIDTSPTISRQYSVRGVPTLMMFSRGKPIGRALVGANPVATIEKFIVESFPSDAPAQTQNAGEPPPARVPTQADILVPRRIPGWNRRRF